LNMIFMKKHASCAFIQVGLATLLIANIQDAQAQKVSALITDSEPKNTENGKTARGQLSDNGTTNGLPLSTGFAKPMSNSPAKGIKLPFPPSNALESIRGMVGIGTWNTQAEFKNIKVTQGNKVLYTSDFSHGMEGLKIPSGKWQVVDDELRQTGGETPARVLMGDPTWSDYTLSLQARKLSGAEGFLVIFGSPGDNTMTWWNVGGWGNTASAIQAPGMSEQRVPGTVETGKWYDLRVELKGNQVRTFLDGQLVQSAQQSPPQRDFPRALVPDLIADPSVAEFDGTFYLYATTDGDGRHLDTAGLPVVWKSKDFLNWSFEGSLFSPNYDAKYWAPSATVLKDGRYYLFPTLNNRITALVSDSPAGPFRTLDGKDINQTSSWKQFPISVGHPIDAELFRDDDGTYYMMWSQRYIAKMKPDFTGFEGEPILIQTKRTAYSEGPIMFKRNGIYYYVYTQGGDENYQYAYMMSKAGPLGPWKAPDQDLLATTDIKQGIFGPGHGTFFHPKGSDKWVFVYLEFGRGGTNRQVLTAPINFNADGTIQPIQLTPNGVGALRPSSEKRPNLALGAQAMASSTRSDVRVTPNQDARLNRVENFVPANALDGSNSSRWMAIEADKNAWYQLDLGKARKITRSELYFVQPTRGHAYRLEYSLDGQKWQSFGGHEDLRVQSPHTDKKSVRARYLRLSILQGTSGLWEWRVF
jgi:hypothetical protein